MVCVILYSYQKCDEFCSQANLLLEKYKKDKVIAEEAWIHLKEHKFDVTKAVNEIERRCQVLST